MSVYRKGPIRRSELWRVSQVLLDLPPHSPSFVLLLRSLFVGLDAESRMPQLRRGSCLARWVGWDDQTRSSVMQE